MLTLFTLWTQEQQILADLSGPLRRELLSSVGQRVASDLPILQVVALLLGSQTRNQFVPKVSAVTQHIAGIF